jgi:hypothetical protein
MAKHSVSSESLFMVAQGRKPLTPIRGPSLLHNGSPLNYEFMLQQIPFLDSQFGRLVPNNKQFA